MGWSLPQVPARPPATAWSPWVCLFIILSGVVAGLAWALFSAPAGGLSSLSSGAWLPLSAYTLVSIIVGTTLYLLWWEGQALSIWFWNSWRLNMRAAWRRQAHQHLCVVSHVVLTPEVECVPRLIGLARRDDSDKPSSTLLPGEALVPGIFRFEQLCRVLIAQATSSLARWYPAGRVTVIIQTSSGSEEAMQEQRQRIVALWQQLALPWSVTVEMLPVGFPFGYWNTQLPTFHHPLLVLALHYREPGEAQAEFASALLLAPPDLIPAALRKEAMKLFRAMPLKTGRITAELKALRDMAQQPAETIRLVWFSGLTAPQSQLLSTATRGLSLSLSSSASAGGFIDFDKGCERYGPLASWLMLAAAVEAANYDMGSHWLVWADAKQGWAMVAGNQDAEPSQPSEEMPAAPFPAGGLMLAVLLNALSLWFLALAYPAGLFSWGGMVCILLIAGITLPGIALFFRRTVARLLYPVFIRAAGEYERDAR
ncbi:hypothetical protein [Serratia proteamaculans]